ncbi:unnamed protein product [Larinioides sclopetarius]|uniref:MATH domain-containing protein n=1 Tax=Larinioides sclopetarius TaxID=280406 RepID=A0AAV2BEU0_9ARAC
MAESSSAPRGNVSPEKYDGKYGHTFYYAFNLLKLGDKESWTFREEFSTDCPVWPSSWLCEVVFRKVLDDGHVFVPITLKRTDIAGQPLKIRIETYINDEVNDRDFMFDAPPTEKGGILGGHELKDIIIKHLPSPEERERFNRKLHIKFFIYVSSCHKTWEK